MSDSRSTTLEWVRALVTPVAVVAVGSVLSYYAAQIPVRGRLTEVAVEVLRAPPTDSTQAIRQWAQRVIDKYSGVSFGPAADSALSRARLPASTTIRIGDIDPKLLKEWFDSLPGGTVFLYDTSCTKAKPCSIFDPQKGRFVPAETTAKHHAPPR